MDMSSDMSLASLPFCQPLRFALCGREMICMGAQQVLLPIRVDSYSWERLFLRAAFFFFFFVLYIYIYIFLFYFILFIFFGAFKGTTQVLRIPYTVLLNSLAVLLRFGSGRALASVRAQETFGALDNQRPSWSISTGPMSGIGVDLAACKAVSLLRSSYPPESRSMDLVVIASRSPDSTRHPIAANLWLFLMKCTSVSWFE